MTKRRQRCCWCLRTDTERRPANPAVGPNAQECVDEAECIATYQKLIDRLTTKPEAKE